MSKHERTIGEAAGTAKFDQISAIQPGLVVVNIIDPKLVGHAAHVRNTFERLALGGKGDIGLPMPEVELVCSIYFGNARQIEQARSMAFASKEIEHGAAHKIVSVGEHLRFDACSNEGLAIVTPLIKQNPKSWISLEWMISTKAATEVGKLHKRIPALQEIHIGARQVGAFVMVFTSVTDPDQRLLLHDYCSECIEVEKCDPNPGDHLAFRIDCVGLRNLHALGLGHTMCSIRMVDGRLQRRFNLFESTSLKVRLMNRQRGMKKPTREIGKSLGVNSSTVSRQLRDVPYVNASDFTDDDVKVWVQACEELEAGGDSVGLDIED